MFRYRRLLLIYPWSNGIQDESDHKKKHESEESLFDSFFRIIFLPCDSGYRHLDTGVDEHEHSEKGDDEGRIFYKTGKEK